MKSFLIGRGDYSYYMTSTGWFDADWRWHSEFDARFGEPCGPPTSRPLGTEGGLAYSRCYTHGVVSLDCPQPDAHCVDSSVEGDAPRIGHYLR